MGCAIRSAAAAREGERAIVKPRVHFFSLSLWGAHERVAMDPAMQHDHDETQQQRRQMPPLLRFLGLHLILGTAIGTAFVSLIVLFNLAGLKDLLVSAEDPVLPLALLYVFNVFTFSSVSMGIAVMLMRPEE